ncbi:MAG: cytochrome c [Proteobacteria bacterium]|nr:cytochrome c [Pseudomonadota bacterium]
MKDLLIGLGLLSSPVVVFVVFGTSGLDAFDEGSGASVSLASVEPGLAAFAGECARCHGRLAEGTERGPNLIHRDYGPRVRSDARFRRAVREGMPARRGYGAMPPFPELSKRRLERMISFVRGLQRANGIR